MAKVIILPLTGNQDNFKIKIQGKFGNKFIVKPKVYEVIQENNDTTIKLVNTFDKTVLLSGFQIGDFEVGGSTYTNIEDLTQAISIAVFKKGGGGSGSIDPNAFDLADFKNQSSDAFVRKSDESFWRVGGNGNLSGTEYIGTNEDLPFVIKQNGEVAISVEGSRFVGKTTTFNTDIVQDIDAYSNEFTTYSATFTNKDSADWFFINNRIILTNNKDKYNNNIGYYIESSKYFSSQGGFSSYWFSRSSSGRFVFSEKSFTSNLFKYDSAPYSSYETLFVVESPIVFPGLQNADGDSTFDREMVIDTNGVVGSRNLRKNEAGQVKVNYTGLSLIRFDPSVVRQFDIGAATPTISTSPTTIYPNSTPNNYSGIFDSSRNAGTSAFAGRLIENPKQGQAHVWRIIGTYANKTLNQTGELVIGLTNPVSNFSIQHPITLPNNRTGGRFSALLYTIADSASITAPNGYILTAETSFADVDLTINIESITRFSNAIDN